MVNSDDADASLQRTDKHAEGVGKTFIKGVGTAAKFGVGLAVAGAAGAVALFGLATKASEAAANIDDVAQRTGLSAKTLQEFKHAAEMSGTSMEVVEKSAVKLTATMGKYASGNKETVGAFKELGVSAEDSKGKLRSTDEVFPELIQKLAGMTNETERNALSMKLFGKGAVEMAPLLNEGAKGVTALKDEAHKMGLVMSDEQVKAGAKFDDSLTLMKSSLGALVNRVGNEALPIMQTMLEWFTNHMPQIQAVTSIVFGVVSSLVKALGGFITSTLMPAFTKLYNWILPNIPLIKQTIQTAFDAIKLAIKTVSDTIMAVITWVVKFKDVLIPLGAGITAGALVFGIYTLALKAASLATKAHTLVTTIATTVTTAFGAVLAFITSPIGIVVIAIGLLIAAGILLYKNWDLIKAKTGPIFEGIKTIIITVFNIIKTFISNVLNGIKIVVTTVFTIIKGLFTIYVYSWLFIITTVFNAIKAVTTLVWNGIKVVISGAVNGIKSVVSSVFNSVKSTVSNIFNGIKSVASSVWNGITSTISGSVNGIKSVVSSGFNAIKGTATNVWNGIKSAITTPFNAAKNTVVSAINTIKSSFSNLHLPEIKFPSIKLPHFGLTGSFDLKKMSVPKLGVDWYEKGGVFDRATQIGVGENGREAVMPLEKNTEWIDDLASKLNGKNGSGGDGATQVTNINLDGKRIATVTTPYADRISGSNINLMNRGLIV